MKHLTVREITKQFAPYDPPALQNASFSVKSGEIFGLLGPSGCGKTTALRIIAGFEHADTGHVELDDTRMDGVAPEKRKVGFVFQDYALFPNRSVRGNVEFALHRTRRSKRRAKAEEMLEMVGLLRERDRMPGELSGGQQQRVALARALAADPEIILLDEPFSNLDAALRDATRRDVRNLLKRAGVSAVLVTHDQEEALSFCDKIGVMQKGAIEQIGTPEEIYMRPQTSFVAQFLGRANLLRAVGHGEQAQSELGTINITPKAEGPILVSLRPEHLVLSRFGTPNATVMSREFRGHDLTYRVRVGSRDYLAHTEYTNDFKPGEQVRMINREPAVVLRETGLCRRASFDQTNVRGWSDLSRENARIAVREVSTQRG